MDCASCVNTIESTLKATDGVKNVAINFATEKATIEYDTQKLDEEKLAAVIESTGYHVATNEKKISVKISGMHCASCAQKIEKALINIKGVSSAVVNFATRNVSMKMRHEIKKIKAILVLVFTLLSAFGFVNPNRLW
jgi:Cu+-exporting ATPase